MQTANQPWDPKRYSGESGFVREGGKPVVELLAPRAGERVLDLGCGPGELTQAIALSGAQVVGLDASESMIAEARRAYPALDFRVGRAEALGFEREFDAIFSNATLHWIPAAAAVADGLFRALKPGGRLVAEFGGHGNVAAVRAAVNVALEEHGIAGVPRPFAPWYFPKLGQYASLLESHGFALSWASTFARPSAMPDRDGRSGIRAWLEIFASELVTKLPEARRAAFFASVEHAARGALFRDGAWWIDYVRLRLEAVAEAR